MFWRRIVTDPMTGAVLDIGRRRRHTRALGEHVRTRDRNCVFPGCTRPAEDSQIDHTTDHAHGGPTAAANLGVLCQHHNLMKQATTWRLQQPEPGRFVWTSPTGTTHHVTPEPMTEPDDRSATLSGESSAAIVPLDRGDETAAAMWPVLDHRGGNAA